MRPLRASKPGGMLPLKLRMRRGQRSKRYSRLILERYEQVAARLRKVWLQLQDSAETRKSLGRLSHILIHIAEIVKGPVQVWLPLQGSRVRRNCLSKTSLGLETCPKIVVSF